ncbi:hypothetical protein C0993_000787, partial [Termitomyces sp. T159_Od127]
PFVWTVGPRYYTALVTAENSADELKLDSTRCLQNPDKISLLGTPIKSTGKQHNGHAHKAAR